MSISSQEQAHPVLLSSSTDTHLVSASHPFAPLLRLERGMKERMPTVAVTASNVGSWLSVKEIPVHALIAVAKTRGELKTDAGTGALVFHLPSSQLMAFGRPGSPVYLNVLNVTMHLTGPGPFTVPTGAFIDINAPSNRVRCDGSELFWEVRSAFGRNSEVVIRVKMHSWSLLIALVQIGYLTDLHTLGDQVQVREVVSEEGRLRPVLVR